ncbi:MAG TPA: hypothetical protein VLJ21_01810 [Candidatus Binatia bacterium]|nr:hypothetical protein [Candidatus Binatia bacterium]
MNALLFNLGILLASLVIMAFSGSYFVDALIGYARKIGMSNYFIGMVVVAVATSSPDIATSVMGLISGKPEILSGVVIGGLMLDAALLNGWFAILARKIKLDTRVISGIELPILALIILPYILLLDGSVSRSEGLVMVISFVAYLLLIWKREKSSGRLVRQIAMRRVSLDITVFLLALGAMLIAARVAVFSAINLSASWGVPVYLLSITLLALASAMPDGIAGTVAILKKKGGEIGFGESIGTSLIEVNLFTGLVAMFRPFEFGVLGTIIGMIGLIISMTLFMFIMRKGEIRRSHGIVFLAIYVAYIILEVTRVLYWGA